MLGLLNFNKIVMLVDVTFLFHLISAYAYVHLLIKIFTLHTLD